MPDIVQCPKCGADIPLTEALARPLIEAEQARLENEIGQRRAALESREQDLRNQHTELAARQNHLKSKESEIDATIQKRLDTERAKIQLDASQEAQKSQQLIVADKERTAIRIEGAASRSAESRT